jgi:peptidoglycan/xylan/chitin deacetylase (PgdA/CDA1 family)
VTDHATLTRRVGRVVARLVGVPLGVVTLVFLRLTARKAGIAIMYHSVDERAGDPRREVVPPHPVSIFERQIAHVARHYRLVPAKQLLEAVRSRRRGEKFPLAITFDDDLACHVTFALPILRRAGAPATFFLCGASLEQPFAFPWERLQRAFDAGVPEVESLVLGTRSGAGQTTLGIHELWAAIEEMAPDERDSVSARLSEALGPDPPDAGLRAAQVRELVDGGMEIGFHTLRHDALTRLDDERLAKAMTAGADSLAAVAGTPLVTIGYPHGRADARVADAARAAGFAAGFTTRHVAVTPDAVPHLLGRVGPSFRSVGALAIELAVILLRGGSGRASPAPEPTSS